MARVPLLARERLFLVRWRYEEEALGGWIEAQNQNTVRLYKVANFV